MLDDKKKKKITRLLKLESEPTVAIFEELEKIDEAIEKVQDQVSNIQLKKGDDGYTPKKDVDYFDGEDGKDYNLTESDKEEIASKIKVPIVEKVIEKTIEKIEIVKEPTIVNQITQTVDMDKSIEAVIKAIPETTGEMIVDRINQLPTDPKAPKIDWKHIKNAPIGLNQQYGGVTPQKVLDLIAENAGGGTFLSLSDTPDSYTSQALKGVRVNAGETALEFYTTIDTDEKVKLSASDPTAGYLDAKLQEGIQAIQFDLTPTGTTPAEGHLQWNDTDGTLDLGMSGGDVTMQIGQEMFVKVRNTTGSTLENGKVVYFSGSIGNRPLISYAQSNAESTSRVAGVLTQDIANNSDGFITGFGYVRKIKTNYSGSGIWGTTWVEGDVLYVSKTNAGVLTNVEPSVPHHSDIVGFVGVVGPSGSGSILVNIQKHHSLENSSDVNGTPLTTTGQFPVWNQTNGYFDFDFNINNYLTSATAASTYVPYTGATGDVDLAGNTLSAQRIYTTDGFDASGSPYGFYNTGAERGFLNFGSLTTDRTFTFPDVTGTIALTSDLTGFVTGATNTTLTKTGTTLGLNLGNANTWTASITLRAGTATAGTAPLYMQSGTSLTVPVAGAVEMTTDDLFFTITTGTARKRLLMADAVGGLTSGRLLSATTNGRVIDYSTGTWNGTTLALTGANTASVASFAQPSTGTAITTPYPAFELVNTNATANNFVTFSFADAVSGASYALIGGRCTDHTNNYGDFHIWTRSASGTGVQANFSATGVAIGNGSTVARARLDVVETANGVLPAYFVGTGTGTGITNIVGPSIINSSATTNNWAGLYFNDTVGNGSSAAMGCQFTDRTNNYGDIAFATRGSDGFIERARISKLRTTFTHPVRLKGYTVATLPAGTQGDTAFCTDLLAPTFFAIAVGGGAVVGPVFYNGTNWICT